jgi:hypothetical protein
VWQATSQHPALLTFSATDGEAPLAVPLDARHVAAAVNALRVIVGTLHAAHRTRLRIPVEVSRARTSAHTTWTFDLHKADRAPNRSLLSRTTAPRD